MAAGKILGGLVLVLIGLGLFADSVWNILPGLNVNWLSNFIITVTGIIPILLIILGLFVVWLEADELKAKREIRSEASKVAAKAAPAKEEKADKQDKPNVELKK